MFAKGNLHANGVKLVDYILSAERDERAELGGARGFEFFSGDLRDAARLMQRMADATTNCEKPWFHTQTRLPADERLTPEQWEVVRAREEKRLGFSDLPCVWSFHVNEATGERHMHAAWFRVDVDQERAVDPGLFKMRLKETCRSLEREFGLRELDNHRQPHDRAPAADRNEVEEARRLGTNDRAIRTTILDCYQRADSGRAFVAAIEERGFILASGDKRDCFCVIDHAGGHHALNKKLTGQTLAQTRSRFADLDRTQLPSVEQAQALQAERHADRVLEDQRQPEKGGVAASGAYEVLGEVGRQAERDFRAAGARVTEAAAPVFDRDAASRAADDRTIEAAIDKEEATRAAQEGRQGLECQGEVIQDQPAARGRNAALETPQTDDICSLGKTACDIRIAWQTSRTASELEDGLASRGITLALVSAEEAAASHHVAAFAKEIGNFVPRWREGEIVAVDGRGDIYRLDQRSIGDLSPEIEARLAGIDRAGLLNTADAQEAMRAAAHETWKAERAAEREQARPASWIESRLAECAAQAPRLGATVAEDAKGRRVDRVEALADRLRPDDERQTHAVTVHGREAFAARLEEAGIAIVRVTETDATALAALREAEKMEREGARGARAHKGHHFAELLTGDLAAVTRNGDVYRINPDKFSDAKRYLDVAGDLPGVAETRARFEIEGEKIAALWDHQRAAAAEARQDLAAERESAWQHGQLARELRQSNRELGEAVDTGFKATGGFLGSIGKLFSGFVNWLADSIAPPPPPTRDQAERMARSAEEKQEARAQQEAQEAQHEFILREIERSRQSLDQMPTQTPTAAELYGTPKQRVQERDNERRDRGLEL